MQPPREFLVFRLWGPMASWGEIAVGERRGSWSRPSRSAILGLVAAALGIERNDTEAHRQLDVQLGFAVRVDHPGKPLRDYHTAQAPSQKRGVRWATRRAELNPSNDINTILSERGYYQEADAVIALWLRETAPRYTLADISARLIEPVFTLYLGRKSCPLGLPLVPKIASVDSLDAAFHKLDAETGEQTRKLLRSRPSQSRTLWLSEDDLTALGIPDDRIVTRTQRRDNIRDRRRWLFDDRAEVEIAEITP